MTDLIDTTEMYLRTILELEEENIVALRARIAERLRHSGPTVSQTVGRMERDGLVVVSGDRHLELTETGRKRATEVMRKHRLAERLLADVIGLDWAYVHDEACRWEHVMSGPPHRIALWQPDSGAGCVGRRAVTGVHRRRHEPAGCHGRIRPGFPGHRQQARRADPGRARTPAAAGRGWNPPGCDGFPGARGRVHFRPRPGYRRRP